METLTYLDTHVVAWLYAGEVELLPSRARMLIDRSTCLISPITLLELQYLHEIRRTSEKADVVLTTLQREIGVAVCDQPFSNVVLTALEHAWTRDPFDRIIVSQAAGREALLLTKDETIHANYSRALWD